MAVIDTLEVKLHATLLGLPELEHLLAMLEANVENLPTIVVKAMTALTESVGAEEPERINLCPADMRGLARAF